ncbi:hypothetical protein MJO28_000189 [Puccinia striiformis f. sp. tritici]|uniref:Fatty acid desaturase domain-containing protein n=4 Tax=Puccinia striiformis TaxID=27350 RepID=A0A0L0VLW0_9BASI|nr:hypothetical protein Pst134EA_001028 [Puccinia striiformis f. sp. tritici]KAI9626415.1 hypothetical protein H4Q26_017879 [Puccinia striiformis f. sp. tritici PST-130]KNF00278.1 hypothetical protein PSTG_06449 [Puccinia striiformis f. sp. tritici PST-78]POV94444.1 hypothetical protein PSHT_16218 [Puccinia striiformis]KAH9467225.1 hypothetical protein Pst134EB_002247 [Puccinia striiformis f. sp. tritici]KAH9473974.1 hypothetical protein Pst134EA_001028 [Puccinia striiformis f. sp. tritici]
MSRLASVTELHQRIKATPVIHLTGSSSSSTPDDESYESSLPIFELPDFTVKELLAAIPAHCFQRSVIRSSLHLILDLTMAGSLIYMATFIDPYFNTLTTFNPTVVSLARFASWAFYGYASGLVWVGIWVIAHECGHQAFSSHKTLNNTIGLILHSILLVPYHSWRISHARHHASTCHLTRDQVFVPKTRSEVGALPASEHASQSEREGHLPPSLYEKMDNLFEDAPLWNFFELTLQQLFGWSMYILVNASGQSSYPSWTNHFNPNAIIYDERHRSQVLKSDIGVGLMLTGLTALGLKTDFMTVFKYYIVPYLNVNHWIVLITFIQHTDPLLPHYRDGAFNFQRGALATIDRKIHGFFFHGIAETHTVHHLCSKIPHYNAWEATAAIKEKLGKHYHYDDRSAWVSLWKVHTQCRFVEDEGDVVFWKNAKGQAFCRLADPVSKESVSVSGDKVDDVSAT